MVRNTTTRDRAWTALRRHGSGSFSLNDMVESVSAQYRKLGRPPPKRISYYTGDHMNLLTKNGYLKRRPGQATRFKPQERLNEISHRSRTKLPNDAHPKAVGDFYNMETGNLKAVTKRELWHELLTVREEMTDARDENARLTGENAQLRAVAEQERVPSEGSASHAGGVSEFMEVDDSNPFLVVEDHSEPLPGPSHLPETPLRVQPSQSYPTPPSTVQPPARQVSVASAASEPIVDAAGRNISQQEQPLEQAHLAPILAPVDDSGNTSSLAGGDAYDEIFLRAAQAVRLQMQKDRQADRAEAGATSGTAPRAGEAELAVALRENEVLAGERDLYKKKHFVTSVALKGSQIQVEKRDAEAVGLVGNIARSLGLSRWM